MINRVFVYGTLMEGMENYGLIEPYVLRIAPAILDGAELYHLVYGYPALVFAGSTACVKGQIVELRDIDKALPLLDELEDFFGKGHPDNLYDRKVSAVYGLSGEAVKAYVYVWARPELLPAIGVPVTDGCWRRYRERHIAKY